jgi:hypothetical protein
MTAMSTLYEKTGNLVGPAAALFGFYCAINGGRIGATLGCQVQNMLGNNIYVSQGMAFITLLFFTSLVTTAPKNMEELVGQGFQAIGLYIVYLMTTKIAKESFVILMAILSIVFILRKFTQLEEIYTDEHKLSLVKGTSNGLLLLGIVVLLFGVASYTGQKLIEYKDNKGSWSWRKYIFGHHVCANDGTGSASQTSYTAGLKRLFGVSPSK